MVCLYTSVPGEWLLKVFWSIKYAKKKIGNIISAVHLTTLEKNGVSIRTCNITYLKRLLSESDVNHIKYLNFGDLTPKDNYAVVEGK